MHEHDSTDSDEIAGAVAHPEGAESNPKRKPADAAPDSEVADPAPEAPDPLHPNPRFTTTHGWLTTPKFGAAGSGGAENEPGPERD